MNVRNFPKPPFIVPPIYRNETISHFLLIIIILYQKYICKRYVFFIYNIEFHRRIAFQGFPSGRCVAHCAFEITLLQAIMLNLLLVCSFSPRVHSIPRGPRFYARNNNFLSTTCQRHTSRRRQHRFCQQAKTSFHRFYKVPFREILTSLRSSE